MKQSPISIALLLLASFAAPLLADYPIVSNRYLADPSPLVTGDRVYVYCSNDDESPLEGSYNIPNVICVSSSDMKNWTDHGSVFRAEESTKWAKKTWAPAAIERDGKYYLYFGNGGANIGVVVSDSPTGPFEDVLGKPLIEHGTPGVQPARNMWLFDPGVFIDDDGQAYIYFGGNGDDNVRVARLKKDMVTLDGEVIKMTAPNFFEAAWVWKRNGKYYFSYSTTPKAQMRIDYMTGDDPIEGFEYAGVVANQPPVNHNNNHAAEFRFKDRWYHVYHNRIVAKEAGIPTGFRRNLAIEEFTYDKDGKIKKVEYTTDGVRQLGSVNPFARAEAETFRAQQGIETIKCDEGGLCLADLENGDWVKVVGVDFKAGAEKFHASVACEGIGGRIEVRLGDFEGTLVGTCKVGNTGGAQQWETVSCEISGATGRKDLCLVFTGGEGPLFNVDCWKFQDAGKEETDDLIFPRQAPPRGTADSQPTRRPAKSGASDEEPPRRRGRGPRPIQLGPDDKPAFAAPPAGFNAVRRGIRHGKLEMIEYPSKTVGTTRRMQVYTPPGYSKKNRYPVLYLLHGIGGDETEWQRFVKVDALMDNLIADNKAKPMIVVMPNGRAQKNDRAEGDVFASAPAFAKFERDLLDDVIPAIEKRYGTLTDREGRALAGLSMGGGQTLNFGLTHLETFAWLGAFSAAPNAKSPAALVPDPDRARERLKLLFLSCGSKDGLLRISQGMHAHLKEHEVPHVWHVDGNGHDPSHWGNSLHHFAQKIFR